MDPDVRIPVEKLGYLGCAQFMPWLSMLWEGGFGDWEEAGLCC